MSEWLAQDDQERMSVSLTANEWTEAQGVRNEALELCQGRDECFDEKEWRSSELESGLAGPGQSSMDKIYSS
jgi:hypothetical protein